MSAPEHKANYHAERLVTIALFFAIGGCAGWVAKTEHATFLIREAFRPTGKTHLGRPRPNLAGTLRVPLRSKTHDKTTGSVGESQPCPIALVAANAATPIAAESLQCGHQASRRLRFDEA